MYYSHVNTDEVKDGPQTETTNFDLEIEKFSKKVYSDRQLAKQQEQEQEDDDIDEEEDENDGSKMALFFISFSRSLPWKFATKVSMTSFSNALSTKKKKYCKFT